MQLEKIKGRCGIANVELLYVYSSLPYHHACTKELILLGLVTNDEIKQQRYQSRNKTGRVGFWETLGGNDNSGYAYHSFASNLI